MASTKRLEDTLPPCDSHHNRASDTLSGQWPIYSLVTSNERCLKELESDINKAEDSTSNSLLITKPDSSNGTLRDVYDHHIRFRDENDMIHPTLFIAVDQRDYQAKGVLVVDLQVATDTSQTVIGVLRCGYEDADLYCANLDIGNMSFIDYKEEEQRLWGGEDPYENKRYFSKDATSPAPPLGKQHYAWYSNVEMAGPIQELLEPGWVDMDEGQSRLHRAGGWYNFPDPWHEIRRQFPYHCLQQPELHRKLFLVAEKAGNKPDAVSVCKAEWDGDLEGYHYDPNSYEVTIVQKLFPQVPTNPADKAYELFGTSICWLATRLISSAMLTSEFLQDRQTIFPILLDPDYSSLRSSALAELRAKMTIVEQDFLKSSELWINGPKLSLADIHVFWSIRWILFTLGVSNEPGFGRNNFPKIYKCLDQVVIPEVEGLSGEAATDVIPHAQFLPRENQDHDDQGMMDIPLGAIVSIEGTE
ncbi:hypothetical protein KCU78_g1585, partial [Aureobasidium melanogenum]